MTLVDYRGKEIRAGELVAYNQSGNVVIEFILY